MEIGDDSTEKIVPADVEPDTEKIYDQDNINKCTLTDRVESRKNAN